MADADSLYDINDMSSDLDQDQSAVDADAEDEDASEQTADSGTRKKSKKKKRKPKDIERSSGDSDSQAINEETVQKQNRLPIFPLAGRGDNSPSGVDADSEGQASQSAQESGQAQTPSPSKPLRPVASSEAGASAAPIQDGDDAILTKAGGEASGINLGELHKIQKALEILNLPPSTPKNLEDGARKRYQFWDTQPVPKFDEKVMDNGPIEEDKPRHEVRSEPYSLPHGFQWDTLDINDPLVLKELYTLLNENYVEDDDNMFRFDYSPEFLKWALQPPGWLPHWHCGVRVTKSGKLVGFISAIPTYVKIYSKRKNMVDINFLCVHKKLRSKRMTPVLIKEVTRRVHQEGLFQAVYTAGIVLPKPIACCRYWHRSLNPRKLIEVKFSHLSRNMTMQRTLKLYKLPEHPKTPGFRPFSPSDVKDCYKLMSLYLNKFDLSPIFSPDEFRHWFIPQADIVNSFVVENNGVITDFVSFYTLPSTVMHHPVHKSLKAAYSFYNVSTRTPWIDLMCDTLVAAKNMGFDVFNALDLMENKEFLEKLKFGIGDGNLQYYLYNWRCPAIDPKKMALVLQ